METVTFSPSETTTRELPQSAPAGATDPAGRTEPAHVSASSTSPASGGWVGDQERPDRGWRGRARGILRGNPDDPSWARPALLSLLFATAAFYFWNLTSSGYANSFYSAAVQAGSASWKAFFFGSLDASNAITVDKPPAALWVMALSVRLFGLNSFAILMPEVLMGVATVGVVYATVKRASTAAAGLIAGAIMALTPVAVLMFRFNNPDALLVLLMALGAWATLRSIERGSPRWMALTGVFIGLGFLTKTLQVLLVVPFFGLAYLLFANTTLRRRIIGSLLAVASMVLSAGWWVAIVELIPAGLRPYIGGSQTNSFLELTFGYNGLGRISGNETGSVGGQGPNSGTGSLWRMFSASVGGQISWLIPSALILLIAGLWLRARAPRTDLRRAALVIWGGWLVVTGLTFSLMEGIFHEYYTVALAPAVAAVVGLGAAEVWEQRRTPLASAALSLAIAVSGVWSFVLLSRTTSYGWLRILVLALAVAAAALILAVDRLHKAAAPVVIGAALTASLMGPAAYSLTTISTAHTGSIVTAGPASAGGFGGMRGPGAAGGGAPGGFRGGMPGGPLPGAAPGAVGGTTGGTPGGTTGGTTGTARGAGGMGGLLNAATPSAAVVEALSANASSYRWVAATIGSQNAAGLQLGTQLPVMAVGGFNGSDPAPTLAQFQAYVADGQIHYFLASGGFGQQNGGSSASAEISSWVQQNYAQVTIGSSTFYDLTQPLTGGSAS